MRIMKDGIVSKDDYTELHEVIQKRRNRRAEGSHQENEKGIQDILASPNRKYQWL